MRMNRGFLLAICSNWPQTDLVICFHIPDWLSTISLLLSLSWWCNPIIYTQTTVLCLWGVTSVLMAERWAACLRGSEGEGGRVGEGQGGCGWRGWKSIMYTDRLPAWLAGWLSIWNCKSFPLYITQLPPLLLSTLPVLSADSEMITMPPPAPPQKKDVSLRLDETPEWKWQNMYRQR